MDNETNTKAEIIALFEGRTQVNLENIRQFILNLDERDFMEFLYPSDPDFAEEVETLPALQANLSYLIISSSTSQSKYDPGSPFDQDPTL